MLLTKQVDARVQEDAHESFEEYEADRKRVRAAYMDEVRATRIEP
jgi:hypothetical protein